MRAALAIVALLGCHEADGPRWRGAGNARPRDGGTLRFAVADEVRTLDPTEVGDEVSTEVAHAMFDTLVDYAPAGLEVVPRLAERWDISPDGREYRFILRRGLRYADGAPIVAGDFKYSLERALTTRDAPAAQYLDEVEGARALTAGTATTCVGIVAPDDGALVIRLRQPSPTFLYVLAMVFTTPQRASHVTAAGAQLRRLPLASGPFMLARWREGEQVVLARNPRYHDPQRAHLDAIVLSEHVPRDLQFLMLERGDLDAAEHPTAPDYQWLMAQPAWRPYVKQRTLANAFGMRMDVRQPPLQDRRVRQALNYAVNKAHLVKLLGSGVQAAHGVLAPDTLGRDESIEPYPHDVAAARRLLAAADLAAGFDLEYVTLGDEQAERVAASLQQDLAEVGVRIRITEVSLATYVTWLSSGHPPAFSLASWQADLPDPMSLLDPLFASGGIAAGTNNTFHVDPDLEAVLAAARREPVATARAALYRRAERLLYDDAPWIWGYHQPHVEVIQPYVRGYDPHPIWLRDYTSAWLDLDPTGARVAR